MVKVVDGVVKPRAELTLRIPPTLKAELERCATEHQRSLNAEIVYRLNRSLDGYRR